MPIYDVHSYRQIRVKTPGIVADSPVHAIAIVEADEGIQAEIRRLVDVSDASGPVSDVEYQDGGVPVGWLVDPLDEHEDGHGDGIAYDATQDFEPVLRRDPDAMPSEMQKEVLKTFNVDTASISEYDDARNVTERLDSIDPLAAAMFRILDGADDDLADVLLDGAVCRIQALRKHVADNANRPDPRMPPGVFRVLRPYGLKLTLSESDDDQTDDEIEIRKPGFDEPIGSIRFCGENDFMASTWTNPAMEDRRSGGFRRTAAAAAGDAVVMLKRDGWIA